MAKVDTFITPATFIDREELRAMYPERTPLIEDDRVTAADAEAAIRRQSRADAIAKQSREVTVTLAPGELHPRDRIAHLERELARTEEARVELAQRLFTLHKCGPYEDEE